MSEQQCTAKHTLWNPTKEKFTCPKCGIKCGDFHVDEIAEGAAENCERLHDDDLLVCTHCDYICTGREFSQTEMKKGDTVICPCCKGKGYVPSNVASFVNAP